MGTDLKPGTRESAPGTRPGASDWFSLCATTLVHWTGSRWAFLAALAIVLIWAGLGPLVGYSETWQLVINTGTTIVTFLMVFLLQSSQNRDTLALHLKMDEIIRALDEAENRMMNLEDKSIEELEGLRDNYDRLAAGARAQTDMDGDEPDSPAAVGRHHRQGRAPEVASEASRS